MHRFFKKIILPLFNEINAKHIVEVGCLAGDDTLLILDYCGEHDGDLIAIDPAPSPRFDVEGIKNKYGNKFKFYKELSLERLPLLSNYDVILIDGDHNWYTVYNELKSIEKNFNQEEFPIIILHDVAWPYARRDLYYDPSTIPPEFIHPYKKAPMFPGSNNLSDFGINQFLNNAIYENTPKNGVLTAVEDFLEQTELDLEFYSFNAFNGLGVISANNRCSGETIIRLFYESDFVSILETNLYKTRLTKDHELFNKNIEISNLQNENESLKKQLNESNNKISSIDQKILDLSFKINELNETNKLLLDKLNNLKNL